MAILCAVLLICATAYGDSASEPWWGLQWPFRVQIDCPAGSGDAAQVSVILAGRTTADGADLRVVDDRGKQQPFEVIHHDPQFRTLLAIRVPADKPARLWLYFGNVRADKIRTNQPDQRQPAWQPQAGVKLRTYRKAGPQYPKTLADFMKMLDGAAQEGGAFVHGISHGHNPFGLSEQYISVYEGYLRIDNPGTYGFCTASADGSWIVIDGKQVVEWPGPHGWGGSERGQINGTIELQKGVARVQYYHEAGAGPQMAFMGWKPPGRERFEAIPPRQWTSIRTATAGDYQSQKNALVAVPDVQIANTYWLPDTIGKQLTLVQAEDRSCSRRSNITRVQWNWGDGLSDQGAKTGHVYFRMGRPTVELTVTDADGNTDTARCSPNIVLVDVQAGDVRFGSGEQYARISSRYDPRKMPRQDLALYVEFWQRMEKWQQYVSAARVYVERFDDAEDVGKVAADVAELAAKPQAYDPVLADNMYATALRKAGDDETRTALQLRRAHNLAWGLSKLDEARKAYQQMIDSAQRGRPGRAAARAATIGLGDVALLAGDLPAAKDCYARAEQMVEQRKALPDQPTELAKLGSYPWAVEDYLARGEYDEAMDTLDEWEGTFPLQKLEGTSLLLRGKVLFIRSPSDLAARFLELAERVNPAGTHVPEAVWLRASCLLSIGKVQEAADQFARVASEFTRSEFAAKAREKLNECQAKLKASSSL